MKTVLSTERIFSLTQLFTDVLRRYTIRQLWPTRIYKKFISHVICIEYEILEILKACEYT